jgi:hypothetical protein
MTFAENKIQFVSDFNAILITAAAGPKLEVAIFYSRVTVGLNINLQDQLEP